MHMKAHFLRHWRAATLLLLLLTRGVLAAEKAPAFHTPVRASDFDPAAGAQWVDGAEQAMPAEKGQSSAIGPQAVFWTREAPPVEGNRGVYFGDTKSAGVRHLRVGFKMPIPIGAVVVRGGGQLSVLKASATYPGNLGDDSQWMAAQRIVAGQISRQEAGPEDYAVWVLPPGTATRALRFTHEAGITDHSYAGWLGGAMVLSERVVNVAPQAVAGASGNDEAAGRIVNESNDGTWKTWDNGKEGAAEVVSPEHPQWLMLVWPRPTPLSALGALWAGFAAGEVQVFAGNSAANPVDAPESDWHTVQTFDRLENQYPRTLGMNWIDMSPSVTARAIRLRITRATVESHGHLQGKTFGGRRIWLGELLALRPLGDSDLAEALPPAATGDRPHPPIAIRFSLPLAGRVTLVIEDAAGKRVRNLVSDTAFPAGENVAWWDGLDDLGRDAEEARHGIYATPGQFVAPGEYRVRGLVHQGIDLRYEFSIYNAGNPAWETADTSGGWLTNHTPPMAALFVPADKLPADKGMADAGKGLVFIGSYVSEGGAGLAWVDLAGKKRGGRGWVGGNWTAAPYLARDAGASAVPGDYAYVASAWDIDSEHKTKGPKQGEIRVTALSLKGDRPVIKYLFEPAGGINSHGDQQWKDQIAGLAVHDGRVVVSMAARGELLVIDAKTGAALGVVPLESPRGVAFDASGRLLVLQGRQLCRYALEAKESRPALTGKTVIIADGLEDPQHVIVDESGRFLVTDRGASQQVKIFSPDGKFLSAIGHAGPLRAGPYDPLHMQNPAGLTLDGDGHLWVTEADYFPKRVSVWTLDGKLLKALYGPAEYGGGGTLDPRDKTRFFLHGMEFKLDWDKGTDQLARVFYRPDTSGGVIPDGHAADGLPETPLYLNGQRYFTNCYNCNPTGGSAIAMLWIDRDGLAAPVAAMGRASDWSIFKDDAYKSRLPKGIDLTGDSYRNPCMFAWSDLNGDGKVEPDEVTFLKAAGDGITVMPDLSFVAARIDEKAVRFAPVKFTAAGVPVYGPLDGGEVLSDKAQHPTSSGGDQVLVAPDGSAVLTVAPGPFAPQSMGGTSHGQARWSYPSVWPGLHASHESAVPTFPGELVGTTRLLGSFVTPGGGSDAGPLWAINGNQGNAYVFTADGLFVAQLFQDVRQGVPWSMPAAQRGMLLNDVSLHDENFWPSITQTADGKIYLVDGGRVSLVRVDGLESIRRLPEQTLKVSEQDLLAAHAYFQQSELARQRETYSRTLKVAIRPTPPRVDGSLDDWAGADWATIDKRGTAAYFNSNSKPYDVSAALCVSGGRLYAAFRTGDAKLLENSGETENALFKTGGALDLMIGADANAAANRAKPVEHDVRLLVALVKGKPRALLYRPVVPGTKEPVPFAAPWHAISIDRVDDVTADVQLAGADGNYELSIPLATLSLSPAPGQTIRGDVGILRGNGFQTLQRVYWNNKATAIVSDVPSEAELTPALWGKWQFMEGK
jgi:hypothetical protein